MLKKPESAKRQRRALKVYGTVQGVGFRPFVYGLAVRLGLSGLVRNEGAFVRIEVEGPIAAIDEFVLALRAEAPPLSRITSIEQQAVPAQPAVTATPPSPEPNVSAGDELQSPIFSIEASAKGYSEEQSVPPDAATCADCLNELFDEDDFRYRYPFINCTNCGPRFTIIAGLPYDRRSTSMHSFNMCAHCRGEYDDPLNRRFHAQPNACHNCGPGLAFVMASGAITFSRSRRQSDQVIASAVHSLTQGLIVAIKGLGGFHLACNAQDERAVQRLRARKRRWSKPLAVMMKDLDAVRKFCLVSEREADLLLMPARPIVLLKKAHGLKVARSVAGGTDLLGVMLPYTPLQNLILAEFGGPLVMTSGNVSEEPIVAENTEALARLGTIADAFVLHDRDIISRYDDSVVRCSGSEDAPVIMIRRARGFAPAPLPVPFSVREPVLAVGGHLKNTFCLITGSQAFLSQHQGDLENLETLNSFEDNLERLKSLFGIVPSVVAHDLHPDYLSTMWAAELARRERMETVAIQHHHAHITACMCEHKLAGPVIGVAFDGMGYGTDGTAWGGEFLLCDLCHYERLATLCPVPMPGGAQAIKQPWRMLLSHAMACRVASPNIYEFVVDRLRHEVGAAKASAVEQLACAGINSPLTSSCGRLFDAMAVLLGVGYEARYEAELAMKLESKADAVRDQQDPVPYHVDLYSDYNLLKADCSSIFSGAIDDLRAGAPVEQIALRFHKTVAWLIAQVCERIGRDAKLHDVCLSGGVFQNKCLLNLTIPLLRSRGFRVFFPQALPANDGGISLGQGVAALAKLHLGR